jgi:MFS family permease
MRRVPTGGVATGRLRYESVVSLRPIGWVFLFFGAFWGGWAVAAVDVERALGLSTAGFGLLLSVALVGGASSNAVGGSLCERFGTGKVLGSSLFCWAVLLSLGAAVREPVALGVAIVAMVAVAGLVDVAINVGATAALADQPGRLVAFHARFNIGAATGAALMGVLLGVGASWRWMWVAVAVVALCVGAVCHRAPLPAGERGDQVPLGGMLALLRREGLLMLAGAFALAAMVEGGIELWGVLFLRTQLTSGLLIGAGGAVLGYSVAALARSILGPRVGRRGPARGVVIGAGTAAIGVVTLATAHTALLAALGLFLAAGGISMCWPLLLAQAGAGRTRAGAVVGSVSAVGYLGMIVGPAVVGMVSDIVGLRAALGVLAAAALIVAVVPVRARSFAPAVAPHP